MFKNWEANKKVELVRNPDYNWAPEYMDGSGPSQVANLTYRLIKDTSTRVAALEAGEVDIAELVPPLDMRRFDSSGSKHCYRNGIWFTLLSFLEHNYWCLPRY